MPDPEAAYRQALYDALLDAFRTRPALARMVNFHLNIRLDDVAPANADQSEVVFQLLEWAQEQGRVADLLPAALAANPDNPKLKELAAAHQPLAPGPQPPVPPCPYLGLQTFSRDDATVFGGRDADVEEALRRVQEAPWLFIIGPSGVGKSSLVYAGLLPRLPTGWTIVEMRPGPQPAARLLSKLGAPPGQEAALPTLLAGRSAAGALLLLVDQAEEAFAQADPAEQVRFWDLLHAFAAQPGCHVLVTLRADFYGDLMNSALWEEARPHRLELAPLHGEALRTALRKPAASVGVTLDPALVERLVADAAGQTGSLPLLQVALRRCWGGVRAGVLPLAAYEALGGDDRAPLAAIVDQMAEAVYTDLLPDQQVVARRIFLRLVQPGEGRPATRRQQPVAELEAVAGNPAEVRATLHLLAGSRLITTGDEAGAGRRVDLAHEALIAGWRRLAGWLEDQREALPVQRRLEDWARYWVDHGRGAAGLLDAARLAEAAAWLASPAADLGINADVYALVQASRAAVEAHAQEQAAALAREQELLVHREIALSTQQELLVQREIALRTQQELLAQQEIALQTEQELRQQQTLNASLHMTLLEEEVSRRREQEAALEHERALREQAEEATARAEQQTRVALALALAAHAAGQVETNRELAALLAAEAVQTTHRQGEPVLPLAEEALHRALDNWPLFSTLQGHLRGVSTAAFSPDGQRIATASTDAIVRIWNITDNREQAVLHGHTGRVNSVAFSADEQLIVTASADGTIRIWSAINGREQVVLHGHTDWVRNATFSPDGHRVITASDDRTSRVWSIADSREQAVLRGHSGIVCGAAFSPDGQRAVTTSSDGTARLWSLVDGYQLMVLRGHTGIVRSAAFSPDGQRVVTVGDDGTARIWYVENGSERAVLRGHREWVRGVAFSPDGQRIVTASADGTARVWNASDGSEQAILGGHMGWVLAAAFSSNGSRVVTTSADGAVRHYVVELSELLTWAAQCVNRPFTSEERVQYLNEPDWVARGWSLAEQGDIASALADFAAAQERGLDPFISAAHWNQLCGQGNLHGEADAVADACERAVALAPDDGGIRDSRGLNRALRGDLAGALADFQAFLAWARTNPDAYPALVDDVPQREVWVVALAGGRNPITPAVLAALREGREPPDEPVAAPSAGDVSP